jgi:hypothetical protein
LSEPELPLSFCDAPEIALPEKMDTAQTSDQNDQNASNQRSDQAPKNANSDLNSEDRENKRPKMSNKPEHPKPLKVYEHKHADSDVQVTFEVMLSDGLNFPNSKVRIVFGPPLSDWKASMVEMRVKEGTPAEITPGNYVYLTGVLPMSREHLSKNIPYKYIIKKENGFEIWEHIDVPYEQKIVNRCLFVPGNVDSTFTKFDDVILSDRNKLSIRSLQRWGRETATR